MRVRAAFFLLLAAGGIAACASIWGFEDATPVGAGDGDGGTIVDNEVVPAEGAPGIVCVPRGPADWQGPLVIYESQGTPPPEPPPCPSTHPKPTDGHANLAPASCACACGNPSGVTCSLPVLSIYSDSNACTTGGTPCAKLAMQPAGTCSAYPDAGACPAQDSFVKVTTPSAPTGGSCTPSGPGVLAPVAWGASVRVCAPPVSVPGTCPPDKVPTPQAELPYQTNYCVAVTGTAPCPALYPKQRVYFTGTSGSRSCKCSCDAPSGGTCNSSIEARDDGACGGGQKGNPNATTCLDATNASSIRLLDAGTPSGVSCKPSAEISGELQPSGPITICCRR